MLKRLRILAIVVIMLLGISYGLIKLGFISFVSWERLDGRWVTRSDIDGLSVTLSFSLSRYGLTSGGPPYYLYFQLSKDLNPMDLNSINPIKISLKGTKLSTSDNQLFLWPDNIEILVNPKDTSYSHNQEFQNTPVYLDCPGPRTIHFETTVRFEYQENVSEKQIQGKLDQYCGEKYWRLGIPTI